MAEAARAVLMRHTADRDAPRNLRLRWHEMIVAAGVHQHAPEMDRLRQWHITFTSSFRLRGGPRATKRMPREPSVSARAFYAASTVRSSRSASPTDQAWNRQPRGVCGGSPSAISER